MKDQKGEPQEIPRAHSVSVTVCEHGNVHVQLLKPEGEIFAVAIMDVGVFASFVQDATRQVGAVMHSMLEQSECKGRC